MQFCKIAHESSDAKYWCLGNNYYLFQDDLSTVVPTKELWNPRIVSWDVHFPYQSKFMNTNKLSFAELERCMESLHFIDEKPQEPGG